MYSGIRKALFVRLTGMREGQVDAALQTADTAGFRVKDPDTHSGSGTMRLLGPRGPGQPFTVLDRPVTVFPYDLEGTNTDTWPAVTVTLMNIVPRQAQFRRGVVLKEDVPGTERSVTFPDGDPSVGFSLVKQREQPKSFDVMIRIKLWAEHEIELSSMMDSLYDILDFKGFLEVRLKDASTIQYDTELLDPATIAVPPGVLAPEDTGEFTSEFVFRVEAYADNTDTSELVRTINSRVIEGFAFPESL